MNLISRQQSLGSGLTRYFTGKPCPRGHIAERMVSIRACVMCLSKKAREARQANPKAYNARNRVYIAANIEKVKAWKSAEQKRNRAAANARNRRYAAAHRDELRIRNAAWQKANPALGAAKTMRYLTAKRKQCPAWADHESIGMIYQAAEVIRTTGFDVHVDHVVPLQGQIVSGLHVHNNLQIIQANANRSKSNHFQ